MAAAPFARAVTEPVTPAFPGAIVLAGGLLCLATPCARGDALSSQSSVSLSSQYYSNPYVLPSQSRAAEAAAVVMNVPLTYDTDDLNFNLQPQVRLARSFGANALLTDYQYLDGSWKLTSERDVFAAGASLHRDSTLYNQFENAALAGSSIYRLEEDGNVGWQRSLSERGNLQLNGLYDHVAYDANARLASNGALALGSYQYWQGSAQYDRALTELWQGTLAAGYGRYEQLDHTTHSDNSFVQMTLNHPVAERWSLSAQGGYSRVKSSTEVPEVVGIGVTPQGQLVLLEQVIDVRSSGGTASYGLNLQRPIERGAVSLSVSRSVQPSGFRTLLVQNQAAVQLSYAWSERAGINLGLQAASVQGSLEQPRQIGNEAYYALNLGTSWSVTEHWALQTQTAVTLQQVPQRNSAHAVGVSISVTLSRQFGRVILH